MVPFYLMVKQLHEMSGSEKAAQVEQLISLASLCAHLHVNEDEVYWLMSMKQLPSWLVGGAWRFDRAEVDAWLTNQQGLEAIQTWVKAAVAEHSRTVTIK